MSKYYVRTNEGAYLKSHAEFTHYWTKKRDDAEQLSLMEAMRVMDHNKDKLKKGVELYIEPIDDEPVGEFDDVTHPSHYNQYSFAVIDIIDEVAPTYPVEVITEMANVIKYALRAPHKNQLKKDLGKIIWYTQRAIENLEKSEKYDYED